MVGEHGKHEAMLKARDRLLETLRASDRKAHPDWIERERLSLAVAANQWADAHGLQRITVSDVALLEDRCLGHVDYGSKLALRIAETMYYGRSS